MRSVLAGVIRIGASIATLTFSSPAWAGEGGASFYLLGSGGPGAAELPPIQGVFFDNTVYYYTGEAKGGREFQVGGNVVAGLDVAILADFATLLWVPSTNALGGTFAFGAALPIANVDAKVDVVLTGPGGGTIDLSRSDDATMIGDPILTSSLSWKVAPETHVAVTGTLNIPVGKYREGELANISFHRWIVDLSTAATWAPPGWDVSGKIGLTFNGENDFTNYDSGTDLHLEGSVERKFSKQFAAGIQAYHLQQITGDSGEGAKLGSFKGRTTAIGPTATVSFMVGKVPVSARVRYFEELGVKNRPDGRAFFFSLDFPLAVKMPKAPPASQ